MTEAASTVAAPVEAWSLVERLGVREAFEAYLSMAEAFYGLGAVMLIEYDPSDPTIEDEQLTLYVRAVAGGRAGADADLEWMRLARERFGPVLCTRITPVSGFAAPKPVDG